MINENWDTGETLISGVTNGFIVITDILSVVVGFALSAANVIVDNWSTIAPVIMTAAVAFGVYKTAMFGATIAQDLMNGAIFACPIFWIIAAVVALTAAIGIFTTRACSHYRSTPHYALRAKRSSSGGFSA